MWWLENCKSPLWLSFCFLGCPGLRQEEESVTCPGINTSRPRPPHSNLNHLSGLEELSVPPVTVAGRGLWPAHIQSWRWDPNDPCERCGMGQGLDPDVHWGAERIPANCSFSEAVPWNRSLRAWEQAPGETSWDVQAHSFHWDSCSPPTQKGGEGLCGCFVSRLREPSLLIQTRHQVSSWWSWTYGPNWACRCLQLPLLETRPHKKTPRRDRTTRIHRTTWDNNPGLF